jgi:hypothetical protein
MALGPFLLLLCVLPTDPRMIILAILCVIGCIMAANFLHVIATGQLVPQQQRYCPAPVSEVTCALFAAANWYAIAILCLHGFYAGYLLLALVSSTLRVSWLPWRPARASLDSLWRLLGILFVCYTPVWITFTFVELREPSAALHYRNELEAELPSHDRLAIRALISLELFGLGCLALWRRLRAVVQSRLASMGAGVAAAAGISELLGYAPTKDLIEFAQLTLRSVRLDQVEMRHLETFRSPSEAYALSTPATLGSIDAFLSHSWHDPLREKCARRTRRCAAPAPRAVRASLSHAVAPALPRGRRAQFHTPPSSPLQVGCAAGLARALRARQRARAGRLARSRLPQPGVGLRAAAGAPGVLRSLRQAGRAAWAHLPQSAGACACARAHARASAALAHCART